MGIHVCIVHKETGEDHPYWDYIRQGHDIAFCLLLEFAEDGPDYDIPPKHEDFNTALYIEIADSDFEQKNRYYNFTRILENDDDYVYCISY